MQLPASMNIAPPPLIRRTTLMPCRATPSGSTSLRTDWKLPITTDGLLPVPEPQGGVAAPGADLLGEHLVQGDVELGGQDRRGDDVPVVVAPAGGLRQGPADGDGHGLGGEAEQHRVRRAGPPSRRAAMSAALRLAGQPGEARG